MVNCVYYAVQSQKAVTAYLKTKCLLDLKSNIVLLSFIIYKYNKSHDFIILSISLQRHIGKGIDTETITGFL